MLQITKCTSRGVRGASENTEDRATSSACRIPKESSGRNKTSLLQGVAR